LERTKLEHFKKLGYKIEPKI